MEIKNYKSGDKVIVQGEEGLCLYVVDSGQLKCTKRFG
jgi:CRP-like cAMP-binding protein